MRIWIAAIVGGMLAVSGCGRDAGTPAMSAAELVSESSDPEAGLDVSVRVDRAEVRTVDRVAVTVEVRRPAGASAVVDEPDWASAGWTVVDTQTFEPAALPDGRIAERRTIVVEPFLDGSYDVPPMTATLGGRSVATEGLTVSVVSVLDAGQTPDLAAAAPTAPPEAPATQGTGLIVGGAALALGAGLVGWRLLRRRGVRESREATPAEDLRRVAAGGIDTGEGLALVHRAVDRLARDGLIPADLAARCERARFDPRSDGIDPRTLAEEALAATGGRPA